MRLILLCSARMIAAVASAAATSRGKPNATVPCSRRRDMWLTL
jgi:hypothetical protein